MSTILGIDEKKKSVKSSMTKLKIARKIIGMLYKDDSADEAVPRAFQGHSEHIFRNIFSRHIFLKSDLNNVSRTRVNIFQFFFFFCQFLTANKLFYSRVSVRVSQLKIIEATNFVALPRQATFI